MKNSKFPTGLVASYGLFAFLSSAGLIYMSASLFPDYQLAAQLIWLNCLCVIPAGAKRIALRSQ